MHDRGAFPQSEKPPGRPKDSSPTFCLQLQGQPYGKCLDLFPEPMLAGHESTPFSGQISAQKGCPFRISPVNTAVTLSGSPHSP